MPTWKEIGQDNFRAAISLYDEGYYRSASCRFYHAAFSVITGELIQRGAVAHFANGRGTPGHAQLSGLVEAHFTQFSSERTRNFTRYLRNFYADRIAADYSLQRIDKQAARDAYIAATKVFDYLEGR